jgi:RNA polymerase-binding transcription factor DksA
MTTQDPPPSDAPPGKCVDCGLPISTLRLETNPLIQRCVRCESERDRLTAKPVTARR